MNDLAGKIILVTGAFGSLGQAVAEHLQSRGAQLALIDRAPVPQAVSGFAQGSVDLADETAARSAIEAVVARLGGVDALVNVAGTFRWESIESGSVDTWDFLYRINLRTALCASKAVLPHLLARGGGRIVNIGANAASKAGLGMGAYAASKSGVARLTESLAEELKDRGVTVNAVLPGIIDTPQNRKDMPDADVTRWVTPEALAAVVGFLISPEAAPITGALLPATGRL